MNINRRQFIKSAVAGWIFVQAPVLAASSLLSVSNKKLVWVMLRGAMDSLHALPPWFDPALESLRGSLIAPIRDNSFKLDRGFGLHPAFENLQQMYQQGQFVPVVAVASGYRQRSHFDGQDQMESGLNHTDYESGWLARASAQLSADGLAISHVIPIALRGKHQALSWYQPQFTPATDELLNRLAALYEQDAQFSSWFEQSLTSREGMGMDGKQKGRIKFDTLSAKCGELLKQNPHVRCAMLEMNGWDTHNSQINRLDRQFRELDQGLLQLKSALAEEWQNTVVIVSTEFGRTAAVNGTAGTDHGTGSALFLLGGALRGKRVLGDWPGLGPDNLFEQRDLHPTSDVRSWMAAVLQQHMGLNPAQLKKVFPDVGAVSQRLFA